MTIQKLFTSAISILFITNVLIAQKEIERNLHNVPVDQSHVKSLVIDANKIKTILYNTGSVSNPGVLGNVLDFVWHGLGYGYELGFLAGARVPSALNANDSLNIIIDGFGAANRSSADGDFAPDGVVKWGWMPTARYGSLTSSNIANNQNSDTWPGSWSTWKGKFGEAIADMEVLYELNDSTDAEFPYYPIPSDTLRRGLGLTVEARVYQFAHPNLEDVLFTMYEITNVSPKALQKMVAGLYGDVHIGGPNNFADDTQDYSEEHKLLYSWDVDMKSDIPTLAPGYFGITLIRTPANKGITSYSAYPFGGNFRPKNDALMYSILSEGSKLSDLFYSKNPSNLGDYILTMGSGFFSLAPDQKEELGIAYMLAEDLPGLLERSMIIEKEYLIRFTTQGSPISITSPTPGQQVQSSTLQVQWNDPGMNNDTTITLYYSNTPDERWNLIAHNISNSGSYQWNVSSMPEGIFYKLHILKNASGSISYDSTGGYFTINKPGDAAPEVQLNLPKYNSTIANIFQIRWLAGDADGDPVTIRIYYSDNNGYTFTLINEVPNSGSYLFDTKTFPNSHQGMLKLEAIANSKTASILSKPFRIANIFFAVTDTTSLKHTAGISTANIIPGIVDSAKITGHTYQVTFDSVSGSLRYNVKDLTSGQMKLNAESMTANNGTGTLFDGMRIWFNNPPTQPDTGRSSFLVPPQNISRTVTPNYSSLPRRALPVDLMLQFGSMDTNSAGNFLAPLDSFPSFSGSLYIKVPFKIINLTDTTKFFARINETVSTSGISRKTGRWDFYEPIVIISPPTTNSMHAAVVFSKSNNTLPAAFKGGDVFYLYTKKPLTPNDVFTFTADVKYGTPTIVPSSAAAPHEFALEQNFPNPFNPETTIKFSLAKRGRTSLTIYDAIGREVQQLFNEEISEGNYSVVWDGNNRFGQPAASGIYFYRLHSGSVASVKKMVLMR